MIRLKMKKCNMILTGKHQNYQHYCLVKLVNIINLFDNHSTIVSESKHASFQRTQNLNC